MNRQRVAASLIAVGLIAGCGGDGSDDDAKLRAKVDRLEDKIDRLETSTSTSTTSTSTTTSTTAVPTTTAPPLDFPERAVEEEVTGEEAAAIDGCVGVTTSLPEGDTGTFVDFEFPMPGPSRSRSAPTHDDATLTESFSVLVYADGCSVQDVASYLDSVPASEGWDLEVRTEPDDTVHTLGGWSFHRSGATVAIEIYAPSGAEETRTYDEVGVSGPWLNIEFYSEDRD